MDVKLTSDMIRKIEEVLSKGKNAELAIRKDCIVLWGVSSKKEYETAYRE